MNLRYPLLFALAVLLASGVPAFGQSNGSNSPYSRFGLGLMNDQSQGFNRSMGGVGQGLRNGQRINMQNPASYSAIDSLTFIFDIGMGLQRTRLAQNGSHQSANNTSFDYVNVAFRLRKGLGMSVGFLPYTSIGYTFTKEHFVMNDAMSNKTITQEQSYSGSGGLHQVYIGAGWNPIKNLSVGANLSFLWGDIDNGVTQSFAEDGTSNLTSYGGLVTLYDAALRTWKADIGVQYNLELDSKNALTLGATIGIGHKIASDANLFRISLNGDTILRTANKAFELPMTYSVGGAWSHDKKLTVAADFSLEMWGNCTTPQITNPGSDANSTNYSATTGAYTNRFRINTGVEYVPARFDRNYFKRINYRAGLYYASPHLKINGLNGPREFGITAGLGLPITNRWNSGSYVNFGVQWSHRSASASSLVTENIFRINIGLTFNEAWFMKWKFK